MFVTRLISVFGLLLCSAATLRADQPVQFNRDVRPIFNDICFKCHGFDKNARKADLRLDLPDEVVKIRTVGKGTGTTPIVPGKPDESSIWKRIVSKDADAVMPPPDSKLVLTAAQKGTIRKWIEEGAAYQPHWAFIPVKQPALPKVTQTDWIRNEVDAFVLARLEKEGLHPSPEADKRSLIRRVTLDLTGVPPTPAEVEAFVADGSPNAYEKVVDNLLARPSFGERMTLDWLDAARYADTHGFNNDSARTMWPWRDWVIEAFNSNKPYNDFIVEQLAGDLLPNATIDQKVATGFCRNHVMNSEGGIIEEEYRVEYVADRMQTVSTVFMGLTFQCARCHDHKYDPILQKDYYQLFSYFNQLAEKAQIPTDKDPDPVIRVPSKDQRQQLAVLAADIAGLEKSRVERLAIADQTRGEWEEKLRAENQNAPKMPTDGLLMYLAFDETAGTDVIDSANTQHKGAIRGKFEHVASAKIGGGLKLDGGGHVDVGDVANFEITDRYSYGAWIFPTSNEPMAVIARMEENNAARGHDLVINNSKLEAHLDYQWPAKALRVEAKQALTLNQWHHVFVTYDGSGKAAGMKLYADGKAIEQIVTNDTLSDTSKTTTTLHVGLRSSSIPFKGVIDDVKIFSRDLSAADVGALAGSADPVAPILAIAPEQRTKDQQDALRQAYLDRHDPAYTELTFKIDAARKQAADITNAAPTAMVMQEMSPSRPTYILKRGQYDQHAEEVQPGLPAVLPPMPAGAPNNRLGLAKWLTDPSHPLTSRVAVNRFWQMYFGVGIVKTVEDFGVQGEMPSNPDLLDWLAARFMQSGWDTKAMQKLMVSSATYRQAASFDAALIERDPENRLLARGPRGRLPAEIIRDNALSLAGLLVTNKIGGPSVMPYQPPGLWEDVVVGANYPGTVYVQGHGDDLYRRSMYTFWKRTAPPPALNTFDAPEREFCTVRRAQTDTPLQALVLLNDPTYMEAARKIAERMMREGGATPGERIAFGFRLATARDPKELELKVLKETYYRRFANFCSNPAAASKLIATGESARDPGLDATELAAYSVVASMILNLDEVISR